MDPLSDNRYGLTPYNYVKNNPEIFIDTKGMQDEPKDEIHDPLESLKKTWKTMKKMMCERIFGTSNHLSLQQREQKEQYEIIQNHGLTNEQSDEVKFIVFETYITSTAKAQMTATAIWFNLVSMPQKGLINVAGYGIGSAIPTLGCDLYEKYLTGKPDYSASIYSGAITVGSSLAAAGKKELFVNTLGYLGIFTGVITTSFEYEKSQWKHIKHISRGY